MTPNTTNPFSKPKLILYVEDNADLRFIMETKLKNTGYNVKCAVDGEDAIAKISELKPDLILLDIMLPGYTGIEILEIIKKNTTSNAQIIIYSNLSTQEDFDKAKELGAKDYWVKAHTTPAQVVEKLKEMGF